MKKQITVNSSNIENGSQFPLLHKYPLQNEIQPAFLYLFGDGEVCLEYKQDIGDITAGDITLRTLKWPVNPRIPKQTCLDLLQDKEILDLLGWIHNHHTIEWNGSNYVGRISDDVLDAAVRLQKLLDSRYSSKYELVIHANSTAT